MISYTREGQESVDPLHRERQAIILQSVCGDRAFHLPTAAQEHHVAEGHSYLCRYGSREHAYDCRQHTCQLTRHGRTDLWRLSGRGYLCSRSGQKGQM